MRDLQSMRTVTMDEVVKAIDELRASGEPFSSVERRDWSAYPVARVRVLDVLVGPLEDRTGKTPVVVLANGERGIVLSSNLDEPELVTMRLRRERDDTYHRMRIARSAHVRVANASLVGETASVVDVLDGDEGLPVGKAPTDPAQLAELKARIDAMQELGRDAFEGVILESIETDDQTATCEHEWSSVSDLCLRCEITMQEFAARGFHGY